MKMINILFFSALLISCNSNTNNAAQTGSKQSNQQPSRPINCYRYANESDTVTLKLIHVGNSITGTLVYRLKEKDKNEGTIQGFMRDDVLIADYTFMSEGVLSVRQVAFKLQGNTFIEGFGGTIDKDGKVMFKSLDSLAYSSSIKLPEIACQ